MDKYYPVVPRWFVGDWLAIDRYAYVAVYPTDIMFNGCFDVPQPLPYVGITPRKTEPRNRFDRCSSI
jgi:hypothetical protein